MGKQLKTASLNSKFTGSFKNRIPLAFGIGGYCDGFIPAFSTKTCHWFLSWYRLLYHIQHIKTPV